MQRSPPLIVTPGCVARMSYRSHYQISATTGAMHDQAKTFMKTTADNPVSIPSTNFNKNRSYSSGEC